MYQSVMRRIRHILQSRTRSVAFLQSRKICSGRESSIIFINARDAVRRSGFQEAKERLRSVVRSVAQSSLKRAEQVFVITCHYLLLLCGTKFIKRAEKVQAECGKADSGKRE